MVPELNAIVTIPEAGATKLYQTSGAPGEAQLGVLKFAALFKYEAPTEVPLVFEQLVPTVNVTAVQGESPWL
jgi:hypothetical protein